MFHPLHHNPCRTDVGVGDEAPDNARPRGVRREVVVKFRGNASQLGQPSPGNVGKVVMLHVVAKIVEQRVEVRVVA